MVDWHYLAVSQTNIRIHPCGTAKLDKGTTWEFVAVIEHSLEKPQCAQIVLGLLIQAH